jgi:Flp pilus assembly protein TadG
VKEKTLLQTDGQAMVEFALVFPIMLFVAMGILQLALIMVAREVVSYSAYCATRAELVGDEPARAAQIACIPISGITSNQGLGPGINIPGWGTQGRSRGAVAKTSVKVIEPKKNKSGRVTVRVTHYFELEIPIANWCFSTSKDFGGYHTVITDECTLPDPQR